MEVNEEGVSFYKKTDTNDDLPYTADLPPEAEQFVFDFDNERIVEPLQFSISAERFYF